MVVPCMVNSRLKICGETKSLLRTANWIRMIVASMPADDQKQSRIADVHQPELLMIDCHDPARARGRTAAACFASAGGTNIGFAMESSIQHLIQSLA